MKNLTNPTLMLPGFFLPLRGRKCRSAQQVLAEKIASLKRKSFKQIGEIFGRFIPGEHLKPEPSGVMSRRSIYSKENTFWAFLGQVLDADGGCKEVVRKLQSYVSLKGVKVPSSSTASYCTARKNLDEQTLSDIFQYTAVRGDKLTKCGLLKNRRVIVVDGTGLSMPDIHVEEMIAMKELPKGSYSLLREALLIGEFERGKAQEITGFKDRAAREVLYALVKKGLLISDTPRGPVRLGFSIDVVERWFPSLYPGTRR